MTKRFCDICGKEETSELLMNKVEFLRIHYEVDIYCWKKMIDYERELMFRTKEEFKTRFKKMTNSKIFDIEITKKVKELCKTFKEM